MSTVALIGCGRIGYLLEKDPLRNKPCTHFGGAVKAGFTIHYACDINTERLDDFAKEAEIPRGHLFTDYSQLLSTKQPEVIIIATWTECHVEIALHATRNKAKIIVLEKPIAGSLTDSRHLIAECGKNNTILIINHERRYDNRYRKLKEIIENNTIGNIKTIHASILTGGFTGQSRLLQGGGPLLHDGTHIIDIIRYICGEIVLVKGELSRDKRKTGFEDRAVAWLKTAEGTDIFLEAGGSRDYFTFELDISGITGRIIIGNGYEKLYRNNDSQYYTGFKDLSETDFPVYSKNSCFTELYNEVRHLLNDTTHSCTSSGFDGHKSLEVIHAIYLSAHTGKEIRLPLKNKRIDLKKIFRLSKTI